MEVGYRSRSSWEAGYWHSYKDCRDCSAISPPLQPFPGLGHIPPSLENEKVTPIPKGESDIEITNHRPIALPAIPAKILESRTYKIQVKDLIANSHDEFLAGGEYPQVVSLYISWRGSIGMGR